jgi:dihydropyrimidine dehydrogenase (NAD+) subunit PreA
VTIGKEENWMMARLETEFLGITFPNPFILAAGPPTAKGSMILEAFKSGWGGAVTKTIALEPTPPPSPRVHTIKTGRDKWGMLDIELFTDLTIERWEHDLDMIRTAFPDRPIIASIAGGGDPDDWVEVVRRLEPRGVNAYEMNVSCPNFAEEKGGKLGQDPEALRLAVSWVRGATDLPVIVKLTPNVTDIVQLAQVAAQAGADGFTMGNSLLGLGGINIDTFEPYPSVEGQSIFGGYGGPGLKPVTLRCTASLAKALPLPILGCGGISKWNDAVEYLAVGAAAVQICTEVMWSGHEIIKKLNNGLTGYLTKKGFEIPSDITGKALANIGVFPDLDLSIDLVAVVNERCNGCGICEKACYSGGYQAIEVRDDFALIDLVKCDGCGLCVGVCPTNAVRMELRDKVMTK